MITHIVLGDDKEEHVPPLVVVPSGGVKFELDVAGDVYAICGGMGGEKLDRGVCQIADERKSVEYFIIAGGGGSHRRGKMGEEALIPN
jgi:hypothetical protein